MGKGLAIFGLLLIIVGILPIILLVTGIGDFSQYFSLEYYIPGITYFFMLGEYKITELMMILLGVGALFLIIGAIK